MKTAALLFLLLALTVWPNTTSSAETTVEEVTLTVTNMREMYDMQTNITAPIGGTVFQYAFTVRCQGPDETVVNLTHPNPQFQIGPAQQLIQCGSVYWYSAYFSPEAAGVITDEVVLSGEFGTITEKIIGIGVPAETPEYWIAELGPGTSAMHLVHDDQRNLLYIADFGNDQVIVFSPGLRRVVKTINVGQDPIGLALSHDNQRLYVANYGEYSISVINLSTQTETEKISVSALKYPPFDIAIVSDTLALIGTAPPGIASGEMISQLDLITKEVTPRSDLFFRGLGRFPVFKTSRDLSVTGIVVEPGSSPTQIASYLKSSNSFIETTHSIERAIAVNNNGSRLVTSNHDCNTLEPNLVVFNQELSLQAKIQLLGCQSLSLVFNPVMPNTIYAVDGRESGIVEVARMDLGYQSKILTFDVPEGYYQKGSDALTISDDGMWLYAPLIQTWNEPPSKLLAVKVGPTRYSDSIAPVSNMTPLATPQAHNWWLVSWTGTDNSSGIDYYEVDYRIGLDGAWTHWLNTPGQSAFFIGAQPGEEYYFRVIAHDRAGNIEVYPTPFDTYTVAGADTSGLNEMFIPLLRR
jgi:YVTN family beta-propeller protein